MAIYVGMLRLARLCARSPGVLGTRAILAGCGQEARLQAVRPLRYAARLPPSPAGGSLGGPAELPWGPIPLWLGSPRLQHLWMARAGEQVPRTQRLGNRKCWPGSRGLGLQLVAGNDPARTPGSGPGRLVLSMHDEHTEGQEPGPSEV